VLKRHQPGVTYELRSLSAMMRSWIRCRDARELSLFVSISLKEKWGAVGLSWPVETIGAWIQWSGNRVNQSGIGALVRLGRRLVRTSGICHRSWPCACIWIDWFFL